jgi:hypothetical protein
MSIKSDLKKLSLFDHELSLSTNFDTNPHELALPNKKANSISASPHVESAPILLAMKLFLHSGRRLHHIHLPNNRHS